ncbi:MAG: biotin transporter BioY [Clostridiales bacterium]|jgi:biotin transport system substrate-specific component|nr:biotin transporter BioY [Clostridiales bacterium]
MKKNTTHAIAIYALFAALTAICAQINIPIQPVQITFGVFAVLCAGALLGPKHGTISIAVYVLLGLVGVPVFGYFKGGITVLLGSTGGYIVGYIAMAWVTGFFVGLFRKKFGEKLWIYFLPMILGVLACYVFGVAWLMISLNMKFKAALISGFVPFLPGDALKIALSAVFVYKIKPRLNKYLASLQPTEKIILADKTVASEPPTGEATETQAD